jgi:prepilin-type N-terminal cleavage/methylation domain-containing protein
MTDSSPYNVLKYIHHGFTLIELITVLVILAIISSVAIAKYFDIQQDARNRALDGALAEGVSRVNLYFGKQVINGQEPDSITYESAAIGTGAGDFVLSYGHTDDVISITATGRTGSVIGNSKARIIDRPK